MQNPQLNQAQTDGVAEPSAIQIAKFYAVGEPGFIDAGCQGAEQACPQCGAACDHTPQEMQGFAMDAAQQASDGLARDSESCRRATEAEAIENDEKSAFRSSGKTREEMTIDLLTQQVAELRSAPLASFVKLENDGTFREWLTMLSNNSMTGRERKAVVRSIRELVTACATAQRSASATAVYEAAAAGNWLMLKDTLPAPYEEVRILVDGQSRIARLAHDRSHFQLATFMASTKRQYVTPLDKVDGWQPLVAAGNGAPATPGRA